jgi:hypothetical protein
VYLAAGEFRGGSLRLFLGYLQARQAAYDRELAYRVYVTDGLQALLGADTRYYDLIFPRSQEPHDILSQLGWEMEMEEL